MCQISLCINIFEHEEVIHLYYSLCTLQKSILLAVNLTCFMTWALNNRFHLAGARRKLRFSHGIDNVGLRSSKRLQFNANWWFARFQRVWDCDAQREPLEGQDLSSDSRIAGKRSDSNPLRQVVEKHGRRVHSWW